MPRSMWRGTISFGMVSIPVRLFTATESQDIAFRQLHKDDNAPIRLFKRCSADGEELGPDEIVKGYEYAKDRYVILNDDDLDNLPVPSKHAIELSAFVDAKDIDPLFYEKGYYMEPEELGKKPFALLVGALEQRKLTAIGKLSIRTKERLCALRPKDGLLVLETLYYADEVRTPEGEAPEVKVSAAEMKIADALIDLLYEPFDPVKYQDEYREAVMAVIRAKIDGQELVMPAEPEAPKASVDLMAALRASVEAARARKAGGMAQEPTAAVAEVSTNGKAPIRKKKTPAAV